MGREYEVYATEFDAQGLEVDEVIFIWSDYIKWDKGRGKWIINDGAAWSLNKYYEALKKYQEKYPEISIKSLSIEEPIKKIIINTYRVLLTRAQHNTKIFVKDKDTREHIQQFLDQYDFKL